MSRHHAELLAAIQSAGGPRRQSNDHNDSYGSSGHVHYRVPVPVRREIAKTWLAGGRARPVAEILAVVESLFAGESHEEKTVAAMLLGYHGTARRQSGPADVDRWLDHLNGWAEIDTLCYGIYPAPELLTAWNEWDDLLRRLCHVPDANRRRAAIVLLTKPVHACDDQRLCERAIATIDTLLDDRDPLVVKAVSWLLRSMVTHHRDTVACYVAANETALPSLVVRETRTKLATGSKRGR